MQRSPFEVFEDAVHEANLKVSNKRGDSFMAQCPTHDDSSPSLSVTYRDGKVLVNCHAGCDTRDIVADLKLEMKDLFDEEPSDTNSMIVAKYPYADGITGELLFWHVRKFPKTFHFMHYDKGGKEVWKMPDGVRPWLYHAPELRRGLDRGEPVWLVEGESDVHAMESIGAVATTAPFGAGHGKWKPFHTHLLKRAREVRIVVDLDEDRPDGKNTGRDYALEVAEALTAEGIKVTLWKSGAGKDASDHVKAGLELKDFKRYNMPRQRVGGTMGDALMVKEFKPLKFAVEGILPQGVAILGAPPKAGKSFISLDMATAVATGGKCLSRLNTTLGDVLYVGMEDSERRLKDRITLMCEGHVPDLSRLEFQTIDSGWEGGLRGLAWMEEWALSVDDARLVVLDTLGKVEPEMNGSRNQYLAEQEVMLRYKRFADRHDLTVLFIHHDRKSEDQDWLNKFSGTKGITGGADTLLYLDFKRGEREGILRVDGRDVIADDIPLRKVSGRPFWMAEEVPDYAPMPDEWPAPRATEPPSLRVQAGAQEVIVGVLRKAGGAAAREDLMAQFPAENQASASIALQQLVLLGVVHADEIGVRLVK